MVEVGEKYRHYKSTGWTDHTYEIMNKAHFQWDKATDMGEVIVCVPALKDATGKWAIVMVSQDMLGRVLDQWETFDRRGQLYRVTDLGILQLNKAIHDQEEVVVYRALYPIPDFPPHVSVIVRCTSEFIGTVLVNEKATLRFTRI